jgi:hypothetical protein
MADISETEMKRTPQTTKDQRADSLKRSRKAVNP